LKEVPMPESLGVDLGTTGGSWVFKQGDLLLGPVQFPKLVELLYAGEVDEHTMIAPFNLEPKFLELGKVERFRVHLAKAKAKRRVEEASQEKDRGERRGRLLRMMIIGTLSIGLHVGGGRLDWWLAIHRPWEKQIQLPEPLITDELPQIKLASARAGEDELTYPDARNPNPRLPGDKRPRPRPNTPANPSNPANPAHPGPKPGTGDDVAVEQQWDVAGINAAVNAHRTSLHPCLTAETRRQKPGWETRVPIEFTIGNDGRVSKLWIDHPDYKSDESELFKCFSAELKKWKFPAYEGEQASISLAFRIQSR